MRAKVLTWLQMFASREYILFLLVGGINTLDCSVFAQFITMADIDVNVAFNIGYLLSNMLAYLLNCYLIFSAKPHFQAYLRFAISYIPNFLIENVMVWLAYNVLGHAPLVSFLAAAFLAMPITFLLVKLYAFRLNMNGK